MAGRGNGRQSVVHIVQPGEGPVDAAIAMALVAHLKVGAILRQQPRLPAGFTDQLHRSPATGGQHLRQIDIGLGVNHQAIAGHRTHHMVELFLDGLDVFENIGVVVFKIVEDQGPRQVMDKLGTLVEKGGIVFVRLDHKKRLFAQPRGDRKVLGNPANQVTGCQPRLLQYPGHHGGGGGFAVGAGHRNHPTPLQHVITQPLGAGGVGQPPVQHVFHRRIAPGQGIADDHQIRCRVQLGRIITFDQLNTLLLQLGAHRGVDVGIGAGHPVPLGLGQQGQTAHKGAADSQEV